MRPTPISLTVTLALLLLLAGGGVAEAAGPQLTDPCGPGADAEDAEAPAAWADVCAVELAGHAADDQPPLLQVSLRVADPAMAERPTNAAYQLRFDVAGCVYDATSDEEHAVHELSRSCDSETVESCLPPLPLQCSTPPPREAVQLGADAFIEDGDTLSLTLVFAGELARWAQDFSAGAVLSDLRVRTIGVTDQQTGTICYGVRCSDIAGDTASGAADFVMPGG